MEMPGRQFNSTTYTYSFNGKRDDKDAEYGWQDYGMREYDKRRGQFISVDPLTAKYTFYTPYQYAGNKPIFAVDVDGLEEDPFTIGRAESNNRAWESNVRKTDPQHAEQRIYEANKNAFLFVEGAVTAGSANLAQTFIDGWLLHSTYKITSGIIKKDHSQVKEGMEGITFAATGELSGILLGKGFNLLIPKQVKVPFTMEASSVMELVEKSKVFTSGGKIELLNGTAELSVNTNSGTFKIMINNGDQAAEISGNLNIKNKIVGFEDIEITNTKGGLGSIQTQGTIGFTPFAKLIKELNEITQAGGYEGGYIEFFRLRPPGSKLPDTETRRIELNQKSNSP